MKLKRILLFFIIMSKICIRPVYIVSACFSGRENFPLGVYVSLSEARELFQLLARQGYVGLTLTKTELHD